LSKSRLEQVGHIHVLTLADPSKRNAIGIELAGELVEHAHSLADARAVVVTGEGTAFCAGADLPDVFGTERSTAEMHEVLRSYYECFLAFRALPCPTFAAVNGAAIGAGLNLALSCDVRIAGTHARFGATFTKIGLHPGGGCTWFLIDTVGRERALRILLEGATLDAREAVRIGLASELDPWLACSIKRAASLPGFDAVLEFESQAQAESTHSERFRDWISQFS
jgi:enoyl-CoA hydratase